MERTDPSSKPSQAVLMTRSEAIPVLTELVLAAVLIGLFAGLAGSVVKHQELAFDLPVMQAVHRLSSPWLTVVMQAITVTASVLGTTALALVLCVRWWQAGRRPDAISLAVTLAGSATLGQALKLAFARPRPHVFPWLTTAGGWSFPSGHTLNAVTLAGLLVWLAGQRLSGRRRVAFVVVLGLWAALVGLSRVYLGVHYPSDVLASVAAGGLCLLAVRNTRRFIHARQTG